jgi:autotransporter-associated beta strand protein
VNIVGNGYTIDMQNLDRAFFIAGGTVAISNLTFTNGNATGGSGAPNFSSGGGAGLGGAIFVGSGTYATAAANNTGPVLGLSAPIVTLSDVTFTTNEAIGGVGTAYGGVSNIYPGGGGGMGGTGGIGPGVSQGFGGEGGGGGFGNNATGGAGGNNASSTPGTPGSAGAWINVGSSSSSSGGAGGNGSNTNGGAGGATGGGGGGGGTGDSATGSGGGGGVGGGRGYYQNGTPPTGGGDGGFGGGGGGSFYTGGNGGFGGGGGGSSSNDSTSAGNGGFGGGGGGVAAFNPNNQPGGSAGTGGFGAGAGNRNPMGGGGLGAGGAIFTMAGATVTVVSTGNGAAGFFANSTAGGTGANNGSAYGDDVFLGGNVAFDVHVGGTLSLANLGGAGNLSDPNVAGNASDPNAQGGLIKRGAGTLVLTGTSYFVGQTLVEHGTLTLAAGASEVGTSSIVVGTTGDASLVLGSNANISQPGPNASIVLGQNAGVQGTLIIGSGSAGGAGIGFANVTSGSGSGLVEFNQATAFNSSSTTYPFYPNITGNVSVAQNGSGTTLLSPGTGNTYTGSTTINNGTLRLANVNAMGGGATHLNGGVLDLNGFIINSGTLHLDGGTLSDSAGGGRLTTAGIVAASGTISAATGGAGLFSKHGPGTVTIAGTSAATGSTLVDDGTLILAAENALGATTSVTLASGATVRLTASEAINSAAALNLNGSTLAAEGNISQTLGPASVLAPSFIDAGPGTFSLTLTTLSLDAMLNVWDWNSVTDRLFVTNGILTGEASNVLFYSDSGLTLLGHGHLSGTEITVVPVPEPSTYAMAVVGLACGGISLWRRRTRA